MSKDEGAAAGLLERAGELEVMSGLLDAVQRGEGALVVVEGSAGIGKTFLPTACGERAAERGMAVLRVRGAMSS